MKKFRVTIADEQGIVLFNEEAEIEETGVEQKDARSALLDVAESVQMGLL